MMNFSAKEIVVRVENEDLVTVLNKKFKLIVREQPNYDSSVNTFAYVLHNPVQGTVTIESDAKVPDILSHVSFCVYTYNDYLYPSAFAMYNWSVY